MLLKIALRKEKGINELNSQKNIKRKSKRYKFGQLESKS